MIPQPEPGDLTIQRVSSRIVYKNQWMRLHEDVTQRRDGSQGIYSYVEKTDFALIIPVERDGFYCLGRLYPAKGMSSQDFTVFVADQLEVSQHSREHFAHLLRTVDWPNLATERDAWA